jgi:hypothetical protein
MGIIAMVIGKITGTLIFGLLCLAIVSLFRGSFSAAAFLFLAPWFVVLSFDRLKVAIRNRAQMLEGSLSGDVARSKLITAILCGALAIWWGYGSDFDLIFFSAPGLLILAPIAVTLLAGL